MVDLYTDFDLIEGKIASLRDAKPPLPTTGANDQLEYSV